MKVVLFGSLVVCALGAGPAEEAKKLHGYWKVTRAMKDGKDTNDGLKDLVLSFVADRILSYDGETLEELYAFKLHPGLDPKGIDFRVLNGPGKDRVDRAIYRLDGKKLEICIEIDPEKKRPTEFSAKKGSNLHLLMLEKVK